VLNAPAYGWVEKLRASGGTLYGKLKQVEPQFEQMVEAGLFKKRSIALNKTADGWSLRHVGFLGAAPPVIKGLADAVFHDSGERFEFAVEDSQMAGEQEKTLLETLKAFFAGRESAAAPANAATTRTFSEEDVTKAVQAAMAPLTAQITELKTSVQAQEATFAEREQRLQLATLGQAAAAKITELKTAGKWVPAFDVMGVPKLFSELAKLNTVTIEFGEGDKKTQLSLLDTAANIFGALPKLVPAGTTFNGAKPAVQFSEHATTSRVAVDSNSQQLSQLAKARAKEKSIAFSEALTQVSAENPELTVAAAMSAGRV